MLFLNVGGASDWDSVFRLNWFKWWYAVIGCGETCFYVGLRNLFWNIVGVVRDLILWHSLKYQDEIHSKILLSRNSSLAWGEYCLVRIRLFFSTFSFLKISYLFFSNRIINLFCLLYSMFTTTRIINYSTVSVVCM